MLADFLIQISHTAGALAGSGGETKMVPYLVAKRVNPADRTKPATYYPQATNYSIIETLDLCKEISNASSLTEGDVQNCIRSFIHEIVGKLELGHKVRLEGLGLFGVTFTTIRGGQAKAEDVSGEDVLGVKLAFRPATEIRDKVALFGVVPYDKKEQPAAGV